MPRNLVYYVATTIDGFIARADGSFDCFLFHGEHFPDLFRQYPETFPEHVRRALGIADPPQRFDTVLMGRHTYEVGLQESITSPYRPLRQFVISRSLAESPDSEVELWAGPPRDLVRRLKAEPGRDIWLCGGGQLAAALLPEIDEFILKINPIMIGAGIPLIAGETPTLALVPLEHRAYANGFVLARYRPAASGS